MTHLVLRKLHGEARPVPHHQSTRSDFDRNLEFSIHEMGGVCKKDRAYSDANFVFDRLHLSSFHALSPHNQWGPALLSQTHH